MCDVLSHEDVVAVGAVAVPTAWAIGGALVLAVTGAMWEAIAPGMQGEVGEAVFWALYVALRESLLFIAWLFTVTYGLSITYLHLYRGSKVKGRRFKGAGRLSQPAGAHRAVSA